MAKIFAKTLLMVVFLAWVDGCLAKGGRQAQLPILPEIAQSIFGADDGKPSTLHRSLERAANFAAELRYTENERSELIRNRDQYVEKCSKLVLKKYGYEDSLADTYCNDTVDSEISRKIKRLDQIAEEARNRIIGIVLNNHLLLREALEDQDVRRELERFSQPAASKPAPTPGSGGGE